MDLGIDPVKFYVYHVCQNIYKLHYTGASHFDDFFMVISFSFFLITKKDNSCLLICFVLQNCRTTIVENGDLVTDSQEVNIYIQLLQYLNS